MKVLNDEVMADLLKVWDLTPDNKTLDATLEICRAVQEDAFRSGQADIKAKFKQLME